MDIKITRRSALALGAGLATASALSSRAQPSAIPTAAATPPNLPIESGATLRVLRPTKFVEPDEVIFRANTARFTEKTGVQVRVDFVGWEDLRPQTAVSARTGAGPDVVVGWPDDPHLFADKLVPMNDVANYLGTKYGGWMFLAEKLGKKHGTDTWISIPMGGSGGPCVYRTSWVKEAGFEQIPMDHENFLKLCQGLQRIGHPPGFALGNAVGDGNSFTNWVLWSHGACTVDEAGKVAINSRETVAALNYIKELYKTFIPGTLSWLDPSNNKAFAAGEVGMTQNGVSMYFAIKNDPATAAIAADMNHSSMPFGAVGKSPQTALMLNAMVFNHSRFKNAAKAYIQFMMEAEQYDTWLTGCYGYWAHPLRAYRESAVWKSDPKILVYRDTCDNQFWNGYKGPITEASGAVTAEYVTVQMCAAVASGQATPEDAAKEAARRIQRYYRT